MCIWKAFPSPQKVGHINWSAKSNLQKLSWFCPWSWGAPDQGLVCRQPTALLQQPAKWGDSSCLYTKASQKAELRTTLLGLLPLPLYCRALSSAFTRSHSTAKCLNTSEFFNHFPSSPWEISIFLCLMCFVPVQLREASLFPLKIPSAPRGHPSLREQHEAPCVTQQGRAHLGWSTTVTSLLFPHFWSHVSDKERLECKFFGFSQ